MLNHVAMNQKRKMAKEEKRWKVQAPRDNLRIEILVYKAHVLHASAHVKPMKMEVHTLDADEATVIIVIIVLHSFSSFIVTVKCLEILAYLGVQVGVLLF